MDYLCTIFHRLNSDGSKLNNQEIRNCIYNGRLNSLLKILVRYPNFKKLFDIKPEKTYRFAFEEMTLRYMSFSNIYKSVKIITTVSNTRLTSEK